jgi:general secretion pathway protein J
VRGRIGQGGFTLIEVLLSSAIIASMMTLIWGSFSISARGKKRAEVIADRYYQVRQALGRMAREISMAYLSKNDQPGRVWPRTFFASEHNSKGDMLMFSYLGHVRLRENAKECDSAVIRYFVEPDVNDRSQLNLMRAETRRLGEERPDEAGTVNVLLEDIDEIHFEFFDEQANEWREVWNTRAADGQPDRLPTKIRITVVLKDEHDRPMTITTATRIHLQNPLWFSVPSQ